MSPSTVPAIDGPFARHRYYRARRVHVSDIREPLVRALYHYRWAQKCERDAGAFSSDPEQRESFDFWMEEAERAQYQCDRILADLRSSRELPRLADAQAMTGAAA